MHLRYMQHQRDARLVCPSPRHGRAMAVMTECMVAYSRDAYIARIEYVCCGRGSVASCCALYICVQHALKPIHSLTLRTRTRHINRHINHVAQKSHPAEFQYLDKEHVLRVARPYHRPFFKVFFADL